MKYKIFLIVIFCIIISCFAYIKKTDLNMSLNETERLIEAMDTVMSIKVYAKESKIALDKAEKEIMYLDKLLRRKSPESEIYKINKEGFAEVSDDTAQIIKRALEISENTNGIFDITIASVMDLWGFYDKKFHLPSESELNSIISNVDYRNVKIKEKTVTIENGSSIDLGGLAKGYTSNKIAEIFKENNIESGIISLGGNVQAIGEKPDGSKWKVAIQHPNNESYIGILNISDTAVITSGGYQRFFEKDGIVYHHIIDPFTGYPAASGLKSVSIISKDSVFADGLSTAVFIMGLEKGIEYWKNHDGFDIVFFTDNNRIYITKGIESCFESKYEYTVIDY